MAKKDKEKGEKEGRLGMGTGIIALIVSGGFVIYYVFHVLGYW